MGGFSHNSGVTDEGTPVIKFWITTRPAPGMERERFDYEWGIIHTSMMVTTPSVLNGTFTRYVQHRSVLEGFSDEDLQYRRSDEGWYSCADHVCRDYEGVVASVTAEDYKRRVFLHRFSDKAMVVELTTSEVFWDTEPSRLDAGGVKVINHIKVRDGIGQADFAQWWRSTYASAVREVGHGLVTRYVQNPSYPGDPSFFAGTLFELGNTGTYGGVEELYFDDLEAVREFGSRAREQLNPRAAAMINLDASFGMVLVERVVFDFTGDRIDMIPSVRIPDSVEQRMVQSERAWGRWNEIRPVGSVKEAGQ
ncbi:MAG: hypothetical protein RJB01_188 [Actinomycetota bacterium]